MTLPGRHVLLGVSGGIASYKACTLARRLTEAGAAVDVVLTASAAEFVRPTTFEALTGRPVLTSLWERDRALAHISLAREPELIVLAPATAHLLARAAQGLADDLLTALLLARTGPILAAPAMNDMMFAHPATAANLETLRSRGWTLVGPATGALAEGPSNRPGRMSEPETIFVEAERLLRRSGSPFAGRRVVVTAGPTRERLDPIRVITNRSSGRMGFALARAAYVRGADVLLIAGPTALAPPVGPTLERVESTADLERAVRAALPEADVLLMAAAPADFAPATTAPVKQTRARGEQTIALAPTPDILETTLDVRRAGAVMVGFAYETDDGIEKARAKLARKQLDLVVLNLDTPESGAETDTNQVTLVSGTHAEEVPLASKSVVAERILDEVGRLL